MFCPYLSPYLQFLPGFVHPLCKVTPSASDLRSPRCFVALLHTTRHSVEQYHSLVILLLRFVSVLSQSVATSRCFFFLLSFILATWLAFSISIFLQILLYLFICLVFWCLHIEFYSSSNENQFAEDKICMLALMVLNWIRVFLLRLTYKNIITCLLLSVKPMRLHANAHLHFFVCVCVFFFFFFFLGGGGDDMII